jgi:3-hydroxymyristoyl/3-hydroxydecanoyl-(acyl carrier protein) dehydratase
MKGLPEIVSRDSAPGGAELVLRVNEDCRWFSGHFPGQPILPGVVQIGWAAHFAADVFGLNLPPTRLEKIKFKRPIAPNASLTLNLALKPGKVAYDYWAGDRGVSSGVLCFGDAA